MAKRKTLNVEEFKNNINNSLLNSPDSDVDFRKGLISVLSSVLMDTGNYNGYTYLNSYDMLKSVSGLSVGIRQQLPDGSWDFSNTDATRVRYF